jgi:DNA-directed RNA polymerase subunit beta
MVPRKRLSFARIPEIMEMPYLLQTQKESYKEFLQFEVSPDLREDKGLQEAFRSVFPILTPGNPSSLEFIEYSFGQPKYSVKECIERGMTYAAPLKLKLQLIVREQDSETNQIEIRDIKEQECYMGEIPLMTEQGTFVINGAERVIVSQLHRSPGVSFSSATHPNGKQTFSARVIPSRGAWVESEVDIYGVMHVMIDRKRKIPATTFLRAFCPVTDDELAREFFKIESIPLGSFEDGATELARLDKHLGQEFIDSVLDGSGKVLIEKGAKVTKKNIEVLREHKIKRVHLTVAEGYEAIVGRILAEDVVDVHTGEVVGEVWNPVTTTLLRRCGRLGVKQLKVIIKPDSSIIFNTLEKDKVKTHEEALIEFFKKMRPGNPVSVAAGKRLMDDMFFNPKRYDLGPVGRHKLNKRFGFPDDPKTINGIKSRLIEKRDLIAVMKYLERLAGEDVEVDDIDHLGNRRIRSVGELLQNQVRLGLAEIEKTARERMSIVDLENLLPQNLINAKPLIQHVKDFFGRSQLSQFMDQTNPLAELTHKRRLSALGPGGLSRERAGFEVRDVHHTHYGRICPIETPEGPNIGLISSLCTFARINPFGFIETPYRKVKNSVVQNEIEYLTADHEDEFTIAQANAPLDDKGRFVNPLVLCREKGDFPRTKPDQIQYMDISPKQLVSVSASLIPFLEHDDANRALMGSNMQRQAMPLLFTESPLVGTGIEGKVAQDSGVCVVVHTAGVAEKVTADEIIIKTPKGDLDTYSLEKYKRSNQNTCMNQKPIIREGDKVQKGQVIADGPATDQGELALGRNILVAFMSWKGYNFEDAILLSERLVKDDVFTSIHIEEFEVDARDTKLGKEEITRDIPNISEESLSKLDENGLVFIGAEVKPSDILVGKVTPKGETELSSEEKLLRAIFGEKAGDVRDASLKVPPGAGGIVVDIKTFSRKERGSKTERDDRIRIQQVETDREKQMAQLRTQFDEKLSVILERLDREIINFETGKVEIKPGQKPSASALGYIRHSLQTGMLPVDGRCGTEIKHLFQDYRKTEQEIDDQCKNQIDRIKTGDELPPGVIKLVKVYVATKRRISVGDKMAGRHGNKGVVAKILPVEDMPFLEDGTPVDMVLNPLGVPSRMNVGQILETHLGWASRELGRHFAEIVDKLSVPQLRQEVKALHESVGTRESVNELTEEDLRGFARNHPGGFHLATSVFDGAKEAQIKNLLQKAKLPVTGQASLRDGLSGELFDRPITVGVIYMMKLAHLVDDKMHARSIGPYSLVTQQPLGGKAQFGGQRLGEMEVWALEAYGAAYTLQELLTVKSDDVQGRTRIYESIVKGQDVLSPGIPESFNVLIKEIQGLGLNMELLAEAEGAGMEEEVVESAFEDLTDESFLDDDEEFSLGDEDDDEDDDEDMADGERTPLPKRLNTESDEEF